MYLLDWTTNQTLRKKKNHKLAWESCEYISVGHFQQPGLFDTCVAALWCLWKCTEGNKIYLCAFRIRDYWVEL